MEKREFRVGDRVWSFYGWGNVEELGSESYPVKVIFDTGKLESYTPDGFWHAEHKNPSLFHANQGKIEFDTDEPIELVDGQPIWVRDSEVSEWRPRHFARYAQDGEVYCYQGGKSKHSSGVESNVMLWQYFRTCLLYTSPSPRDATLSRMPSSA